MTSKIEYVPRVNQIDAIRLDKDINRLVCDQILENLQVLSPTIFSKIKPEIDLLIHSALWLGSVARDGSTFGQQLLVLSYADKRLNTTRLVLHFALTVLPRYVKNLDEIRLRLGWLGKVTETCANMSLIFSVINYFYFLKTGRYPTTIDFLLGLDYISLRNNQRRDIGYKYHTRELLWGGFMEILGLILPIIKFHKLKNAFKKVIFGKQENQAMEQNLTRVKKESFEKSPFCVFCGEIATHPHTIDCGHIYCYYCISSNIYTDPQFQCSICDIQTKEFKKLIL